MGMGMAGSYYGQPNMMNPQYMQQAYMQQQPYAQQYYGAAAGYGAYDGKIIIV
jgi:hypothetical protein